MERCDRDTGCRANSEMIDLIRLELRNGNDAMRPLSWHRKGADTRDSITGVFNLLAVEVKRDN